MIVRQIDQFNELANLVGLNQALLEEAPFFAF